MRAIWAISFCCAAGCSILLASGCALATGAASAGNSRSCGTGLSPDLRPRDSSLDRYFDLMVALSDAHEHGDEETLSAPCAHDRQDDLECLIRGIAQGAHYGFARRRVFLESLPDSSRIGLLWFLDDLAGVRSGSRSGNVVPVLFAPSGPAFTCLDVLYSLVFEGDKAAFREYMAIMRCSDGFYAEYMDDQLVRLFKSPGGVAIREWDVLSSQRTRIAWSSAWTCGDLAAARGIVEGRVREHPATCRDILAVLKDAERNLRLTCPSGTAYGPGTLLR